MGGLAFEILGNLPEEKRFLPVHRRETWFLTDNTLHYLSETEAGRKTIPNLSEEEIKSKSKANALAKALVCTQAFWFVAQCLIRCECFTRDLPERMLLLDESIALFSLTSTPKTTGNIGTRQSPLP